MLATVLESVGPGVAAGVEASIHYKGTQQDQSRVTAMEGGPGHSPLSTPVLALRSPVLSRTQGHQCLADCLSLETDWGASELGVLRSPHHIITAFGHTPLCACLCVCDLLLLQYNLYYKP